MRVDITAEAQADLARIGAFIARDNPARAASFMRELLETCLSLGDFPQRFPLVDRYGNSALRRCNHKGYLIFYVVESERVSVLHLLHGAQDYAVLLFNS